MTNASAGFRGKVKLIILGVGKLNRKAINKQRKPFAPPNELTLRGVSHANCIFAVISLSLENSKHLVGFIKRSIIPRLCLI